MVAAAGTSHAERRRILLLGATGQIGWELRTTLASVGDVIPASRRDADLTDTRALRAVVERTAPQAIVIAAAYTDVDGAETDRARAFAVNATAPAVLAGLCAERGALLVHYSTDYVFDGTAATPYRETDETRPLGVYGESKREGERAIELSGCNALILRTSWVYGMRGRNFLRTILKLARERDELRIVADQVGAPTWSRCVAEATATILGSATAANDLAFSPRGLGTFHLSAQGQASWHEFATAILAASNDPVLRNRRVVPVSTAEFPRPARRPAYSVLDNTRVAERFGVRLPHWRDQLALVLAHDVGFDHSAAALHEP
jgi:dTDP-4-dehydrorhamnose reductase